MKRCIYRGRTPKGTWLYGSMVQYRNKAFILPEKVIGTTPIDFLGVEMICREVEPGTVNKLKVLDLVLKGKWFDMIAGGEKKEEYREIKAYWEKRLLDYPRLRKSFEAHRHRHNIIPFVRNGMDVCGEYPAGYDAVTFHRGYTDNMVTLLCNGISVGRGKTEWGAPEDKDVFIISLGEII